MILFFGNNLLARFINYKGFSYLNKISNKIIILKFEDIIAYRKV